MYSTLVFFFLISMSPIILDFVEPLNETRPKDYFFKAEYGVDPDKYYWFILAHGYVAMTVLITSFLGIESMYIMFVVHACTLFEIVG